MTFFIRYVIVNLFKDFALVHDLVIIRILPISNVNKDYYLEWKPMHILDLILDLHCIIFKKIYAQDNNVIRYVFQIVFRFFLLPTDYKIMHNIFWKTQFEILYQLKGFFLLLYITLLTFLSRPSEVVPTTSYPMLHHWVFLFVDNSWRQTCNNLMPHIVIAHNIVPFMKFVILFFGAR